MKLFVHMAMLGWLPLALGLFLLLPARRAVLVGAMLGLLFLPNHTYHFGGLPDYDKITAISVVLLLGVALFDLRRLVSIRFSLLDIPIMVWCLCPIASSMANQEYVYDPTGLYDGVSHAVSQTLAWGIPYLLGRLYLTDLSAARDWAMVVFIGGLIYVPLCLYEVRMSPQLHNHVYGFFPHSFFQHIRYGGYRPVVFMEHGLQVVQWLTMATITGYVLWRHAGVRKLLVVPMPLLLLALVATIVLCKTAFALVLLPAGIGAIAITARLRTSLLIVIMTLSALLYMGVRGSGQWNGQVVVGWVKSINEQRAESIETRINNENQLAEKARQRPILGWGRWGRWRIYDPWDGRDVTRSDGLWIIAFGQQGLVGVAALGAMFALPVLAFMRRYPPARWREPGVALAGAMACLVAIGLIYNLPNSSKNPFITMAIAGLVSLCTVPATKRRAASAGAISRAQATYAST